MIDHRPRLSQTNTYGWVPMCECGWIGRVEPPWVLMNDKSKYSARVAERTQQRALGQHQQHLIDVRNDIVRRSDQELARIGALKKRADATLQHRGPFGHP